MAEAVEAGGGLAMPSIRRVELERPWSWLASGWRDFRRAPAVGLAYGLLFGGAGALITFALWRIGWWYLILPMTSGFLIMGPILAVGLYETSRRLEHGQPVGLAEAIAAYRINAGQIALMGVALMLFFFFWVRIAAVIFMGFFGLHPPSPEHFFSEVFFAPESIPFVVVGFGVGGVFALFAFAMSVVSIPLLLDRSEANVVTAIVTSFRAVSENPGAMLLWAALIVVFVGFGLVTFYLGLVATLPLIGFASWHVYRDVVDRDAR
jgi:uncharacterized membrane protein